MLGRAVAVGGLEGVAHVARWRQRQSILRHRRAAHIAAAQPLELLALGWLNVDAGVQREPTRAGRTVRAALLLLRPPSGNRLPRAARSNALLADQLVVVGMSADPDPLHAAFNVNGQGAILVSDAS